MSDNKLSPAEEIAFGDFTEGVAGALASGQSHQQIVNELVENSWEQNSAKDFVRTVDRQVKANPVENDSGGGGWLIWVGLLLFINLLSWLFDWPFWVY